MNKCPFYNNIVNYLTQASISCMFRFTYSLKKGVFAKFYAGGGSIQTYVQTLTRIESSIYKLVQ